MKHYSKSETLELNQVIGNQVITGLGFAPKLVLFMTTPDTSDIAISVANAHHSFGAFDGANQWCRSHSSINGSAFTQKASQRFVINRVMGIFDPAGQTTLDYDVSAVSLDADGFTIYIHNPPPINYRFTYLAFGGATFQALVSYFQSGGGGQFVYTGFQPEAVMFDISSYFTAIPQITAGSIIVKGVCTSPLGFSPPFNYCYGIPTREGATPSISKRYMDTGWSIDAINYLGTTFVGGGVNAFLPTGFQTAYFANPTGYFMGFIAMAGAPDIKFTSGQDTLGNITGLKYISGLGFTPRTLIFQSVGLPSTAVGLQNDATFSMGWVGDNRSVNRSMVMYNDYHAQSPTLCNHASHDERILRFVNSGSVITEDADLYNITTDGFNIDMKVAQVIPSQFGYLAIGDTDPVTPEPPTADDAFGIIV